MQQIWTQKVDEELARSECQFEHSEYLSTKSERVSFCNEWCEVQWIARTVGASNYHCH